MYASILNGRLFQEYLDGLKRDIQLSLGDVLFKNKTFQEKYLEYIKKKIDSVNALLSSPGEMTC